MVSIEDFVASTLVEIVRGAARANVMLDGLAIVCPPEVRTITHSSSKRKSHQSTAERHLVDFDLAITTKSGVTETIEGSANLYVLTGVLNGEIQGHSEAVNRVRFSIPIQYSPESAD